MAPNDIARSFKILRKCQNKLDCLIYAFYQRTETIAKHLNSAILSVLNYLFRPVLSKPHYYFIVSLFCPSLTL